MLFIASVEVAPLNGSQMKSHGVGALVYCLIPAKSHAAAKKMLKQALVEDKYRLIRLEFLRQYEGFTWEKDEDKTEYDKQAKRAVLNAKVLYGPFYTWSE